MAAPRLFGLLEGALQVDIIFELLKAGLTLVFVAFVLLAIATLFIVVFQFAAQLDNRLDRR